MLESHTAKTTKGAHLLSGQVSRCFCGKKLSGQKAGPDRKGFCISKINVPAQAGSLEELCGPRRGPPGTSPSCPRKRPETPDVCSQTHGPGATEDGARRAGRMDLLVSELSPPEECCQSPGDTDRVLTSGHPKVPLDFCCKDSACLLSSRER